ncbi:MAG: CRISPR-associated endoribonuclease Cas6 [Candidatus Bipolaricaulota bacterium]|nr:CRISPR-associated endoribonuclease Cas6 [Candidatus Bipolaricaulota bacterium]
MRFEVSCKLSSSLLPVEYRRGFASLIKEAIRRANPSVFERYYHALHILKPFTFSVYFPDLRGCGGDSFEVGERAIIHFSTSAPELGVSVYNGLLALRSYPLFENTLTLERINLERRVVVREQTAIFKTMAPVLVNNKGDANWYLLPGEAGFDEGLQFAISEAARVFLGSVGASVAFHPIQIKPKVIRHYNMHMRGFVGVFELRGDPALLNLIYDIGLGVRRSQGFGMLELVKQRPISQQIAGQGDSHE